jgi:hypothetical protein
MLQGWQRREKAVSLRATNCSRVSQKRFSFIKRKDWCLKQAGMMDGWDG